MKPSAPVDLAASLCRSDTIPVDLSFGWASPIQLRAASHLYGVVSTPIAEAKVLQIGARHMDLLVSFAIAYPSTEITLVELSAQALSFGQDAAERAGVRNIAFYLGVDRKLTPASVSFDYILVPEILSQGSEESLKLLSAAVRDSLSPRGVAYISYRAQPGGKELDILRDLMTMHAHGAQSDAEFVHAARASLSLLSDGLSPSHPYSATLSEMVRAARAAPDEVLVRDYLTGGHALYLAELVGQMEQAGLLYVGDVAPELEIPATFGANVTLTHSLFCLGKPKVLRQQYLDFAIGRKSRQSIFAQARRQDSPLPAPDLGRLTEMRFAASCVRIQPDSGDKPTYRSCAGKQVVLTARNEIIANVIEILSHAWPGTLTFDQLVSQTRCPLLGGRRGEPHEPAVLKSLEFLLQHGVLRYALDHGPYDACPRGGLRLLPELRRVLESGSGELREELTVINRWQEPVSIFLTKVDHYLADKIDGTTDFDRWVAILEQAHTSGVVQLAGESELHDRASDAVVSLIDRFKILGLIEGSSQAWQDYYAQSWVTWSSRNSLRYGHLDALLLHARLAGRAGEMATSGRSGKIQQALEADKDYAEFVRSFNSASWLKAEMVGSKCLKRYSGNARIWHMQASVLRHQGKLDQAYSAILRAVSLTPLDPMLHVELGVIYQSMELFSRADVSYRRALLLDPDMYAAHSNLGNCLRKMGRSEAAEAHCRRAIEIGPQPFGAYSNLAFVLADRGNSAGAIEAYRQALAIRPDHMPSYSNLLFTLCHLEDTPEALFQEHLKYGQVVSKRAGRYRSSEHSNSRDPDRRLRIGFVSGDLYLHAVANFIEPIWANLDREAIEIWVYSNSTKEDAVTERLRGYASSWLRIVGVDDDEFVKLIRRDRIDVLFDLSGHTANNRLPAFARKPAPVQVSWIGYPATTGLAAMDYYILDQHAAPPGLLDDQFTEKLVYLPSCFAFQPYPVQLESNGLPAIKNGYFTFGSFNRASKISTITLDLWAAVLHAVPTSKMLIGAIDNQQAEESLTRQLVERGVSPERLLFRRRTSMQEYLAQHHEVDIVLETFPYTGGTTACHAIWMGVPILTLRGKTRISRQAANVLSCADLPDWIVDTEEDYVQAAVSWTRRIDELSQLRRGMRARLPESFTRHINVSKSLEVAVREMWRRWCEGLPAGSFVVD